MKKENARAGAIETGSTETERDTEEEETEREDGNFFPLLSPSPRSRNSIEPIVDPSIHEEVHHLRQRDRDLERLVRQEEVVVVCVGVDDGRPRPSSAPIPLLRSFIFSAFFCFRGS